MTGVPLMALSASADRAGQGGSGAGREFYEIRRYELRIGDQRVGANAYLQEALLPALNRAGHAPIGVFDMLFGLAPTLVVVIPHRSAESIHALPARLADDAEYRKAGAAFLDAPAASPAFLRVERSLSIAFEAMPRIEAPDRTRPRVFELRRYESPGERALQTKIEMFNTGEIALFKRIGFRPVFFGETLFGARMPNLEYLLAFESLAARERLWGEFRVDPEWKKMSAIPKYQDSQILSSISAALLNPAAYSQI
jgi:hypothetical protein